MKHRDSLHVVCTRAGRGYLITAHGQLPIAPPWLTKAFFVDNKEARAHYTRVRDLCSTKNASARIACALLSYNSKMPGLRSMRSPPDAMRKPPIVHENATIFDTSSYDLRPGHEIVVDTGFGLVYAGHIGDGGRSPRSLTVVRIRVCRCMVHWRLNKKVEHMQTTNITLDQLTPEQLAQLSKQLKATSTAKRKGAKDRWPIVDTMLATKDGDGFKYTTAEIVAALQDKGMLDKTLAPEARAEALKMVQTRKQKLEKMRTKEGALVHPEGKFGYKPSAHGVGPLTVERIVAWVSTASQVDVDRLTKALLPVKRK